MENATILLNGLLMGALSMSRIFDDEGHGSFHYPDTVQEEPGKVVMVITRERISKGTTGTKIIEEETVQAIETGDYVFEVDYKTSRKKWKIVDPRKKDRPIDVYPGQSANEVFKDVEAQVQKAIDMGRWRPE